MCLFSSVAPIYFEFDSTTVLLFYRGKRGIKEHGVLRNAVRNIFILAQ